MNLKKLSKKLFIAFCFIALSVSAQRGMHGERGAVRGGYDRRPARIIPVVPHHAYINMPRRGAVVRVAPMGAVVINHGNYRYHYTRGIYYREGPRGYAVAPAPIGIRVGVLPEGFFTIRLGARPYYYYYGTYYEQTPGTEGYETVAPPVGARVDALPDGYEKVSIDGMTYYVVDGTYYKTVVDEYGELKYEVIGQRK